MRMRHAGDAEIGPERLPVSFAILDNTRLTAAGVQWLCARCRELVVITSNEAHPAFAVGGGQPLRHPAGTSVAHPCAPPPEVDYGCERLTIQSGGTLNAALVREGLVDFVDVVVAPLVVGGRDAPTLVDGPSLTSV